MSLNRAPVDRLMYGAAAISSWLCVYVRVTSFGSPLVYIIDWVVGGGHYSLKLICLNVKKRRFSGNINFPEH